MAISVRVIFPNKQPRQSLASESVDHCQPNCSLIILSCDRTELYIVAVEFGASLRNQLELGCEVTAMDQLNAD